MLVEIARTAPFKMPKMLPLRICIQCLSTANRYLKMGTFHLLIIVFSLNSGHVVREVMVDKPSLAACQSDAWAAKELATARGERAETVCMPR